MKRSLMLIALRRLPSPRSPCPRRRSAPPRPPRAQPFTVVEATIAEMRTAMEQGRMTSRELVQQYLTRIGDLRRPAARGDHRESRRARRCRRARPRAGAGQDPRSAARHPDRAEGQRPHDRHADDRRRARVRRADAAVRGDAHEEPEGRRRDHHRQDRHDRARQLGGRRADADAGQLQRGRRPGLQPLRSAEGPARGDLRRPPRAEHRRIELGHRHRRELLGRQRRHRNLGVDPEPGEPEHAGGDQADGRPHQPLRRDSDHRRPGHRRADGEDGQRRRDHVRRARRRGAGPERSGDARCARRRRGATTRSSSSATASRARASASRARSSTTASTPPGRRPNRRAAG